LLWDLFPRRKTIGWSSSQLRLHHVLLGDEGIPASRLGEDDLGIGSDSSTRRAWTLDRVYSARRGSSYRNREGQSGSSGQARFEIAKPVAWDFFDWTLQWQQLAQRTDAVCFGTLAQRSEHSCTTMRSFLLGTRPSALRICDINLRQTFFTAQCSGIDEAGNHRQTEPRRTPRVMRLLSWNIAEKKIRRDACSLLMI
jgi:fructokinase